MNTFSVEKGIIKHPDVKAYDSAIDKQIFDAQFLDRSLIKRYHIRGFDIKLTLQEEEYSPVIEGRVFVEAALYFGQTVNLSYRVVVSDIQGLCHSTRPLDTDQLIILAGVPLGVEHWHVSEDAEASDGSIDLRVHECRISNFFLDHHGRQTSEPQLLRGRNEALREVFARYRAFLRGHNRLAERDDYDSNYVLVDVWESIGHNARRGLSFANFTAPQIIDHIAEHHKSELMGLLTLYPYEWPYRDSRSFASVCGENIAIDTDDLVLVSDNVALVIGTYGLRGAGAPTDWREVLRRNRAVEHVCWPEYLHILDIEIAKLHTINATFYRLQSSAFETGKHPNRKELIKQNSLVALEVSRMIIDLDAVKFSRYASHKLMYKKTEARLDTPGEIQVLEAALKQFDIALKNIDSMEEIQRSRVIRLLLGFITIASVFQVVFEDLSIPLIATLVDDQLATRVGIIVISVVMLGLLLLFAASAITGLAQVLARVSMPSGTRRAQR